MIHTSHRVDYLRGWRYLLSASYRQEVQKRWESELPHVRSLDIAGGVITVLISTCGVLLVGAAALSLMGN